MSNLEIVKFSAADAIVGQLAGYEYPMVFADEPWNEWVKCKTESTPTQEIYWGLSSGLMPRRPCPSCGEPLSKYYEYDPTYEKILAELGEPGTIAVLGLLNEGVAGFAWSFRTNISQLAALKWSGSPEMQKIVINTASSSINTTGGVRYFSEAGVMPKARGQGIGTQLSFSVINDTLPTVVRTNLNSPMVTICENLGLKRIIGPNLPAQDIIRPDRVLYVTPNQ